MEGDYLVTNLFRVPAEKEAAILRVLDEAAVVVNECGAAACEVFALADAPTKYGCRPLGEAFGAGAGERVCLEIMRFRDRAHCDEVMAKLDADPRIGPLYERLTALIDIATVARGELERRI
jgi:uncharacterized protein YbaA (DUF1428 family)